jgi:DhnA family fructose-bisphosphate aldolase class Ia
MTAKEIRLSRLFPQGKNAVIVAVDHGQTFGPMPGLVRFTEAVERLREADGVLMAPQMIRFSGGLFCGKGAPAAIVRLNWNTIHCEPWGYQEAHIVKAVSVEGAVAVGAEIVLASLVLKTGSEEHDARNVQIFSELAEESRRWGIPLIGEVFPIGGLRANGDEFHDYIKKACRIVCELGADAIKTFYTGDRFGEVVEGTPIPIFALGAEKLPTELDALELAYKAVSVGARGVVFGRNVLQSDDPARFLRQLKVVVQEGLKPAAAVQVVKGEREAIPAGP